MPSFEDNKRVIRLAIERVVREKKTRSTGLRVLPGDIAWAQKQLGLK